MADTLAMSPAVVAAIKSGIPSLKKIVKKGFNTCRQVYLDGESTFARTAKEVLSSRIGRMPDFM